MFDHIPMTQNPTEHEPDAPDMHPVACKRCRQSGRQGHEMIPCWSTEAVHFWMQWPSLSCQSFNSVQEAVHARPKESATLRDGRQRIVLEERSWPDSRVLCKIEHVRSCSKQRLVVLEDCNARRREGLLRQIHEEEIAPAPRASIRSDTLQDLSKWVYQGGPLAMDADAVHPRSVYWKPEIPRPQLYSLKSI